MLKKLGLQTLNGSPEKLSFFQSNLNAIVNFEARVTRFSPLESKGFALQTCTVFFRIVVFFFNVHFFETFDFYWIFFE